MKLLSVCVCMYVGESLTVSSVRLSDDLLQWNKHIRQLRTGCRLSAVTLRLKPGFHYLSSRAELTARELRRIF